MSRFAICIGVSSQQDPRLRPIGHSTRDAAAVAQFLANNGDTCSTIIIDPTSTEVKIKIWDVIKSLSSDDQIIVYFSGHGRRSKSRKLHCCLADTREEDLPATSLSFDSLIEMIRETDASAALIIIDCCYSGAAERSLLAKGQGDALSAHEEIIREASGLSVLTSTNSVDVSWAHRQHDLSMFTAALIDSCTVLMQMTEGWVTVSKLYEKLKFKIIGHSPGL